MCAQAWRFEQTFEARAEQHFGNRLVENERNVVERMRQEVGANHAKIECALEAAAANNVQLVAPGNVDFEQRYNALRQRVFEGYDGYRAHVAVEVQEDIPAYVEASIAEGRELFGMQFNKGDRRVEQHASEQCEMFEVAWFEQTYRELFLIEDSNVCWTLCEFPRVTMKSFLSLWLLLAIVAKNLNKRNENVFCANDIKVPLVPYLNESCMSVSGISPGSQDQNFASANEFDSVVMGDEVCYNVAPVETICSGISEPVGNDTPTHSTFCLDYFNESVPRVSTGTGRQHFASHEPVCDLLWKRSVVRQRCSDIEHVGVSHVAHAEVQSLCQEWTVHGWCDIKHVEGYTTASNTSKCKAVEFTSALARRTGNANCTFKSCDVPSSFVNALHTSVERHYLDSVTCGCKSGQFSTRTVLLQTRIFFRVHV